MENKKWIDKDEWDLLEKSRNAFGMGMLETIANTPIDASELGKNVPSAIEDHMANWCTAEQYVKWKKMMGDK